MFPEEGNIVSRPGQRPPEDPGEGFLFYVIVLVLAFALFAGMLVLATKHLWR
jgi:hypothetical protein